MLTAEQKEFILSKAYIPEHSVDLIAGVSGGEPFFIDDYFLCRKGDWLVVVGFPLNTDFHLDEFERFYNKIINRFRPMQISVMAQQMPGTLLNQSHEKESDQYYTIDLNEQAVSDRSKHTVRKASKKLSIERSNSIYDSHYLLIHEFIKRVHPPRRVERLFLHMPKYVERQSGGIVLNAWDDQKRLVAFYVVDTAPRYFSTYIIGCYSKKNYVSGASDLLFCEMVALSRQAGKQYLHLGLGVNEGIRRFKKKWGGVPTQTYEMCEIRLRKPSIIGAIKAYLNNI
jgi:hypothetical protein